MCSPDTCSQLVGNRLFLSTFFNSIGYRVYIYTTIHRFVKHLRRCAQSIGVDTDRLARDVASDEVQAELDRSRALADVFGFRGTPGLVIGRTVLNGAVDKHLIERILEDERNQPPLAC